MPRRIIKPFEDFFKYEAAGGILLLIFAAAALAWANSPLGDKYEQVLHYRITIGYGRLALTKSLLHWINDGLMTVFFFVVGMEIKRELVIGELKSVKKAVLPIGAALGGMVIPALIYFFFNHGTVYLSGWGIPMATDIAFALGALSLLSNGKAPKGLAVFLAALAIIDDLGAVLVIAVFYTGRISWIALLTALGILTALILANRLRKNSTLLFMILGIFLWLAVLKSGVHATIAGVLLGMTIPVRSAEGSAEKPMLCRMEHALQPWVAFGILPLFALANAGVAVDFSRFGEIINSPVSYGIIAGLFLGKQAGIFGASYLMIRLKIAKLPNKVNMKQIYGASLLGGIGFTMSIFITTLAFPANGIVATAKISIIAASLLSAIAGLSVLAVQGSREKDRIRKASLKKGLA